MAMGNLYMGIETETCVKVTTWKWEHWKGNRNPECVSYGQPFPHHILMGFTVKRLKLVATTSSGHLVYTMKASYARADNTSLP